MEQEKEQKRTPQESIQEAFRKQRQSFSDEIRELIMTSGDVTKIAKTQMELYVKRQDLVDEMYKLNDLLVSINKKMKRKQRDLFDSTFDPTSKNKPNYLLKTEFDKSVYFDSEMIDEKTNQKLFENQIEYIKETLKGIDQINWNLKSRLLAEEYRTVN